MNSNLERIKKALLDRKFSIERELQRLSTEKVSDDQVQDPGDQALISTMEDINISLQHNELNEYDRIIKALDMIEKGNYGICAECGQPIAEKRLLMYPNATRCLACQEAYEERK